VDAVVSLVNRAVESTFARHHAARKSQQTSESRAVFDLSASRAAAQSQQLKETLGLFGYSSCGQRVECQLGGVANSRVVLLQAFLRRRGVRTDGVKTRPSEVRSNRPDGTNCRYCSAPGDAGCCSRRRTGGSGSCSPASGTDGERPLSSSSLGPSSPGTDEASGCGGRGRGGAIWDDRPCPPTSAR
jgi:hypothetical protein